MLIYSRFVHTKIGNSSINIASINVALCPKLEKEKNGEKKDSRGKHTHTHTHTQRERERERETERERERERERGERRVTYFGQLSIPVFDQRLFVHRCCIRCSSGCLLFGPSLRRQLALFCQLVLSRTGLGCFPFGL
eukprot:TRINITY_DN2311_c0_g1_i6.p1 TRINITY_DN2311_c0_g1~~TRINITY_DN2311_c0_g1_i6.p1  ORF type:complete len:137 (+),score=4.25 TRINITY_DN2311_c0_g1_i6:410-820(+)